MTATVVSLDDHRPNRKPACMCGTSEGFVCYPHRLVDLAARLEDLSGDVEEFQFCDLSTFRRLTADVLGVIHSITDDCLPTERTAK